MSHSVQRAWQLKQLRRGLCSICGAAALYRDERCFEHYVMKVMRKRKVKLDERQLKAVADQIRIEALHWRRATVHKIKLSLAGPKRQSGKLVSLPVVDPFHP
jgi:hypothetical protein